MRAWETWALWVTWVFAVAGLCLLRLLSPVSPILLTGLSAVLTYLTFQVTQGGSFHWTGNTHPGGDPGTAQRLARARYALLSDEYPSTVLRCAHDWHPVHLSLTGEQVSTWCARCGTTRYEPGW